MRTKRATPKVAQLHACGTTVTVGAPTISPTHPPRLTLVACSSDRHSTRQSPHASTDPFPMSEPTGWGHSCRRGIARPMQRSVGDDSHRQHGHSAMHVNSMLGGCRDDTFLHVQCFYTYLHVQCLYGAGLARGLPAAHMGPLPMGPLSGARAAGCRVGYGRPRHLNPNPAPTSRGVGSICVINRCVESPIERRL